MLARLSGSLNDILALPEVRRRYRELGAATVATDAILAQDADIVSPNALGAILTEQSIAALKAKVIAGGANNQLATPDDGRRVHERGRDHRRPLALVTRSRTTTTCAVRGGVGPEGRELVVVVGVVVIGRVRGRLGRGGRGGGVADTTVSSRTSAAGSPRTRTRSRYVKN